MSTENPFIFLIDTLFSIYIAIMLIRFILQHTGADFYNPISQFVVKITQPLVAPARRIIPGYKRIDIATLVLVFMLILLKLTLLYTIAGYPLNGVALVIFALEDLISLTFDVFIVAMIIQAILSWVNPDPYHPVYRLLHTVTAPVLRPFQRLIPPISGLDLSVMVAIIALMFLKKLILSLFVML
jgi:YggT family protein